MNHRHTDPTPFDVSLVLLVLFVACASLLIAVRTDLRALSAERIAPEVRR